MSEQDDIKSLRDHFAGLAMSGVISADVSEYYKAGRSVQTESIANFSYEIADAMIKARGEQKEQGCVRCAGTGKSPHVEEAEIEVSVTSLTGAALDWAVAVAGNEEPMHIRDSEPRLWNEDHSFGYSPSTDWAQGGPLIDRGCGLYQCRSETGHGTFWICSFGTYPDNVPHTGETALIAACRAIVADKLGPTVSVPVELVRLPKSNPFTIGNLSPT